MKLPLPILALVPLVACGDGSEGSPEGVLDVDDIAPPACVSDADCDDGDTCWVNPVALWSRCVPACETDADCDGNQRCRTMYEARACVDPLAGEDVPLVPVDDDDGLPIAPLGVECIGPVDNATVDVTFTLDVATTSAMIVPFNADGGPMAPLTLTVPDGRTFDLRAPGNSFLATSAGILGFTAPLFLPQSPLADVLVQPGEYTYTVAALTDDFCSYVVTETAPAAQALDLNIYYVGIQGLDAASAPADPALQEAITTLDAIYAEAGIALGEIRHFDVAPEVADEFAIIEDVTTEPDLLVATSVPPGSTDDELLSVNVFFVADMDDGGVVGISQGIPGPIGLHGTPGSGVVLTAEFLGGSAGNQLTGQILAHELGHWLGLFHTSEIAGGFFDPIEDTERCEDIAELVESSTFNQCPDFLNLMFPFANPAAGNLTTDQASVLGANPVTR